MESEKQRIFPIILCSRTGKARHTLYYYVTKDRVEERQTYDQRLVYNYKSLKINTDIRRFFFFYWTIFYWTNVDLVHSEAITLFKSVTTYWPRRELQFNREFSN